MPGFGNPNRRNPRAGDNSTIEDRAEFTGQLDVQQEMQDVFNAANRSNTALYTVDPRGLATGEFDIDQNVGFQRSNSSLRQTQDTLRVLADETDGRAFVNRNDFGKAMKQIVSDSSAYYLLGYNSTQAPQDGKFHEIKVRVKRSGSEVRSRKGYWALSVAETARAAAPAKPGPPPAVSRALSTDLRTVARPADPHLDRDDARSRREDARHVRVGADRGHARGAPRDGDLGRPDCRGARWRHDLSRQPAGGGRDAGGSQWNSQWSRRHRCADQGGHRAGAARASGYAVSFDAPPGRLQFRMSVSGASGPLDSDDREVVVPDLTDTEVALGTPRVYVARTPREFQAINRDPEAVPTALRDFRRTDRLIIRTEAYGPGNAVVTVTAKLLNKQGQRMAEVPVTAPAAPGRRS